MRRSERIALDEPTRLHPNDWSSLEVRILDLSEHGFRAECEASVLGGSLIRLEVPGIGQIEAQVSWRRRGQIGARFTRPIALSQCIWTPVGAEAVLARLLVQRSAARGSGLFDRERQLREEIREALPIRKGG